MLQSTVTMVTNQKINNKAKRFFSSQKLVTVPAGDMILRSGDTPDGVFYLQTGLVKQFIISDEGKELTIHIYEPGSFFPMNWALNQDSIDFNLEALTNCKIYVSPLPQFSSWLDQNPSVLLDLTKRLIKGMRGLTKRIEVVSLENARSRVVSILLYLMKHFAKVQDHDPILIKQNFTHENLSSLTGLTRERVSIEMEKLKTEGLISYSRGTITILDRKKLSEAIRE